MMVPSSIADFDDPFLADIIDKTRKSPASELAAAMAMATVIIEAENLSRIMISFCLAGRKSYLKFSAGPGIGAPRSG